MKQLRYILPLVLAPIIAFGVDAVWVNPSGGNWIVKTNWAPSVPLKVGDSAEITGVTSGFLITVSSFLPTTITTLKISNTDSITIEGIIGLNLDSAPSAPPPEIIFSVDAASHLISTNIALLKGVVITQDSSVEQTISGVISGTGQLEKNGSGELTLGGMSSAFAGTTLVNAGTLKVNGALGGTVTLGSGATLSGTGSIGAVNNNAGTVAPGNSIGTINITGNFSQGTSGQYLVEIDPAGNSDLLNITGNASISGTALIKPLPGNYKQGTSYTILQTGGTVTGTFILSENHPLDFALLYTSNSVLLNILSSASVLPIPIRELSGNERRMANYIFCDDNPTYTDDFTAVTDQLLTLDGGDFKRGLRSLSASQFGAMSRTQLQNSIAVADAFSERSEKFSRCVCQDETQNNHSLWIQPIGFYNKQEKQGQQLSFDTRMYGTALGYTHLFFKKIIFGASAGYTYSDLHWGQNGGVSNWHSVYLAPSIAWANSRSYINVIVQGAADFFDVERKINFASVNRKATNNHNSYDILGRVDGGMKIAVLEKQQQNLFIKPEAQFNYLNMFEEEYKESGANSLNLKVDRKHSSFIHSKANLRFVKEWHFTSTCLSPSLRAGWVGFIPLTNGRLSSRFFNEDLCDSHVKVTGLNKTSNQMVLGADLTVSTCGSFFMLDYEAQFFDTHYIHKGTLRAEWRF